MPRFLIAVLAIAVLAIALMVWWVVADQPPGGSPPPATNRELKIKVQAGLAVEVAGTNQRIRRVMTAGNPQAERQALLDEITRLHERIDQARRRLAELGDPPAAIGHWLDIIAWQEFLALEREFIAASGR